MTAAADRIAGRDETDMAMPDFLIIGAARCGTTALARTLQQHPDIFFSTPKETHFLAFAGRTLDFRGPGDELMMNRVATTDPQKFAALFDSARAGNRVYRGIAALLLDASQPARPARAGA